MTTLSRIMSFDHEGSKSSVYDSEVRYRDREEEEVEVDDNQQQGSPLVSLPSVSGRGTFLERYDDINYPFSSPMDESVADNDRRLLRHDLPVELASRDTFSSSSISKSSDSSSNEIDGSSLSSSSTKSSSIKPYEIEKILEKVHTRTLKILGWKFGIQGHLKRHELIAALAVRLKTECFPDSERALAISEYSSTNIGESCIGNCEHKELEGEEKEGKRSVSLTHSTVASKRNINSEKRKVSFSNRCCVKFYDPVQEEEKELREYIVEMDPTKKGSLFRKKNVLSRILSYISI